LKNKKVMKMMKMMMKIKIIKNRYLMAKNWWIWWICLNKVREIKNQIKIFIKSIDN
jgi:hypothetical protein